jgi:threonine/homoserine/homoserine lactone efflux protein
MLDAVGFVVPSLLLLAAPGPTNVLLASAGAVSRRGAGSLLIAEAAGYVISVGLLVLLAGPLLTAAPVLVIALKSVAAAWLFWTSLSFWRGSSGTLQIGGLVRSRAVFITTLLNPKTLVIAFGLMPPAAAGYQSLVGHLVGLAFMTTLTGLIWIAGGLALARAGAAPYAAKATAIVLSGFSVFLIRSAIAS